MRFLFTLMLVFVLCGFHGYVQAGQTQFFESIQDLPLMPGLVERLDSTLVFDKPEGRIVESRAEIRELSHEDVREYYAESLPQFGWQMAGQDIFVRQGEELELAFESESGRGILRVMVSPR